MTVRSYVKTVVVGLLALLAAAAAINRIVDPFWYFRDVDVSGFNRVKPEFARYERHIKPGIVRRERPEALIFGNSFGEIGFDPTRPSFTGDGRYRGFNFAMAGADWNRLYCSVRYALRHTTLRRAVIGLPYWSLNGLFIPDCGPLFADMEPVPLPTLLLSRDALKASWRTFRKQHRRPTHTAEGLYFFTRFQGGKREKFFGKEMDEEMGRLNTTKAECSEKLRRAEESGFAELPRWQAPPKGGIALDGLKDLLEALARAKVEVKLLAFPMHALPFETHILCADPYTRWHGLLAIAALVEDINGRTGAGIELWDFQGTSGYLTEKIRNGNPRFWQDTGHFNYEVGATMLDTMFHRREGPLPGEAEPFGTRLTPESIPRRFEAFFRYRRDYLAAHPEFHRELAAWIAPDPESRARIGKDDSLPVLPPQPESAGSGTPP